MEIDQFFFKKIVKVIKKKKCKGIIIDGITCSGKTTFSILLHNYLKSKKIDSRIISKDLFLKKRTTRIKLLKNSQKKLIDQNIAHYNLGKFTNFINQILNKKKNLKIFKLENLYNRKTGYNNRTEYFEKKNDVIYIIEGIYILKNLPNNFKPTIKILLVNDLYKSLSVKLERIRDNSISLESVINEYKNIHLKSYKKYLEKHSNFNFSINFFNNIFSKKKLLKLQILMIKKFLKKH